MEKIIRLFGMAAGILLVMMLLYGCGERIAVNGSAGIVPSQTPESAKNASKEQLEKYVSKLSSLESVFQSHRVKFQSSYSNNSEGFLQVRPIGDPNKKLSEEELAALKQSIYKAVGGKFPLNISVYTIGEQPHMTGKITAIDEKGRFLVVSSEKFLDKEKKMPDAVWYTMSDDAAIEYAGKPLKQEDVAIGSSAKVWSDGLMLSSYPGQTTGLRLEITEKDDGIGDAKGKVTGLEITGKGVNEERMIEVDGIRYRLVPHARVWLKDKKTDVSEIKTGDTVKLWFSGYELGPEKTVTQVVIER